MPEYSPHDIIGQRTVLEVLVQFSLVKNTVQTSHNDDPASDAIR